MSNQIRSSYQIHQNQNQQLQFNQANKKWWDDIGKNNQNVNITYNTSPMNTSLNNSFRTPYSHTQPYTHTQSYPQPVQPYVQPTQPVLQRISKLPEPVHSHPQAPTYINVNTNRPPIYQPPVQNNYIPNYNLQNQNTQNNQNMYQNITYPLTSNITSPLTQNYLNQVRQTPVQGCGCGK